MNNTKLYGPQHKIVVQTMNSAFKMLEVALNEAETVNLSLADNELLADGRDVDNVNPLVVSLAKQLADIGATGFALDKGMNQEEFEKLVGLIELFHHSLISQLTDTKFLFRLFPIRYVGTEAHNHPVLIINLFDLSIFE